MEEVIKIYNSCNHHTTNFEKPPILSVLRECFHGNGLRQRGRRWVCRCVFHQDKTPSMYVYPEENRYHCFGCGADGDSFDLISFATGRSLGDVLREQGASNSEIIQQRRRDVVKEQQQHERLTACWNRLCKLLRDTYKAEQQAKNIPTNHSLLLLADLCFLRGIIEPILDGLESEERLEQQAALLEAQDRGLFRG